MKVKDKESLPKDKTKDYSDNIQGHYNELP